MPTTYYHTVNGRVIGETTGATRRDYMTDALGSVIGTVTADAVENTYRFKPYGAELAATGGSPSPRLLWCGTWGSFRTNRRFTEQYNRARHYSTGTGLWTSVDTYWPLESAYTYVSASPVSFVDPTGTSACQDDCKAWDHKTRCDKLKEILKSDKDWPAVGSVACCDGKPYDICVWEENAGWHWPKYAQDLKLEYQKCVEIHEQHHFKDPQCKCRTTVGFSILDCPAIHTVKDTTNASECAAYKKSIECYNKNLKKCGSHVQPAYCRDFWNAQIDQACIKIIEDCPVGDTVRKWCEKRLK